MPDLLAIVILNYNGEKFLKKFLPSVTQYSKGHRVIVADNASTDSSVKMLQEDFPDVEILELKENYGFAGGYNKALIEIVAKYYILLNSDVEVSKGWIQPMLQLLEENLEIAACQPKILSYHEPVKFEYAGACGGELDLLAYPFCRGRIMDTLEDDKGQYNTTIPVFWASGACLMIRSSVFHSLGGFDDRFFAHMEEIDLCWRIHHAGHQVFICHTSTVYHVGGGTLSKNNPQKTFLNFRNGLWMMLKNSTFTEALWKIPSRLMLDLAAAVMFLGKRQEKDAKAILKAHGAFIRSFPEFFKERRNKKIEKVKKAPLFKGIIVWDYYVRKVKKYKNLI